MRTTAPWVETGSPPPEYAIARLELCASNLPLDDLELVAKHHDLERLVPRRPQRPDDDAEYPADNQVGK